MLPIVAFDETGNTGQNLLDSAQPVFVLASVHMPTERARSLAAAATPLGAPEAKFATLRTSNPGRQRMLSLLKDGGVTNEEVRIALYHKSFMVTTKIVDALVETLHHEMGVDLYKNARHLALANLLHTVVPVFCGREAFDEWQKRFVEMVRNKSDTTIEAFYQQTALLRSTNTQPKFDDILRMIGLTRAVVDHAVKDDDKVALDPAIPSLVQLAAQWTAALKQPFDLVHDQSKPIAYSREDLRLLLATDEEPQFFDHMGMSVAFPIQAPDIRFADSHDVPELQLADLFAGAAATLMRARARREHDAFAEQLLEAGIANFITNPVWPDTAVLPNELGADRRPGSAELDYIVELTSRRRKQQAEA